MNILRHWIAAITYIVLVWHLSSASSEVYLIPFYSAAVLLTFCAAIASIPRLQTSSLSVAFDGIAIGVHICLGHWLPSFVTALLFALFLGGLMKGLFFPKRLPSSEAGNF